MSTEAYSANSAVDQLAAFAMRRSWDLGGVLLAAAGVAVGLALVSYSSADSSLFQNSAQPPANLLGHVGGAIAGSLVTFVGIGAGLLPLAMAGWGLRLLQNRRFAEVTAAAAMLIPAIAMVATLMAAFTPPQSWPLQFGLGGFLGDQSLVRLLALLGQVEGFSDSPYEAICGLLLAIAAIFVSASACGARWRATLRVLAFPLQIAAAVVGEAGLLVAHTARDLALGLVLWLRSKQPRVSLPVLKIPPLRRPVWLKLPTLHFPFLASQTAAHRAEPAVATPSLDFGRNFDEEPVLKKPRVAAPPTAEPLHVPRPKPQSQAAPRRRNAPAKTDSLPLLKKNGFQLPVMSYLEKSSGSRHATVTREALEETSAALQEVLGDYGIDGAIGGARPGPAVTLYEFDPPPGLKASKIENLSGDIARSMGVLSARISTVPGSKLIGIEIPNHQRQTVLLSEILDTATYRKREIALPLALGKSILGDAVVADLARMPHLLIAGTTGSGKSVAINAMILSLLYRHTPEDCKMILIDPKMLEFSVYDDIPHLMTPVVTDPRSAVTALKWVVQEMEERYRKMSQAGVRNLDAFNDKVDRAHKSGKPITAMVDAGVDPETGQPTKREMALDLEHLPRIVVVVDEMADLMMVAGKEIEACVQRLAQMARASGIHVVLATQRPSVDVITGTIKANFPTRISFRLSSKIDSRTILNEQGAETLLGQGDMLYQSEGGKVQRVHAPYVSEEEIEQVVNHLKAQGPPEYVHDITTSHDLESPIPGISAGGDDDASDLYQQAVQIVVSSKRASTSYLQRRLEIGYNRAANLMEQLEAGGVVSPPNNVGRREILIATDD